MAVSLYEYHRPREVTVAVSVTPDYSGDWSCSGAADDIEINAALTYVNALGGGEVRLLQGTFVLANPIIFPGNSLVLSGLGIASFIDGDALLTDNHGIVLTGYTDCTIKDLSIQTEDGGTKTCHCIFLEDGADRFQIDNVWIIDSDADGIHVEGTTITGGRINNCHILDVDTIGINFPMDNDASIYYINITNNMITSAGSHGISMVITEDVGEPYSQYHIIESNTVYSNGANGIYLELFMFTELTNNICHMNTASGINLVSGVTGNNISSNLCIRNTEYGMYFFNVMYSTVEGNTCVENDVGESNTFDEIYITGFGGSFTNIVGNYCFSNQANRDGIHCECPDVPLRSNHVTSSGRYGIYESGGQVIEGNSIVETLDHSIFLTGASASDCQIISNNIKGTSGGSGIYIESGVHDGAIVGNWIFNVNDDGITLVDNNDRWLITNNYINAVTVGYGIRITTANADDNWVKNNHFQSCNAGFFLDNGTDTRTHFINVLMPNPNGFIGTHAVTVMLDDEVSTVRFELPIPLEFQETVTAQLLIVAGGGGNLRRSVATNWGKMCSTEHYNAFSDSIAVGQVAVLADDMVCLDLSGALAGIAGADWIGVEFTRDAVDALDTVNASVYVIGFRLRFV